MIVNTVAGIPPSPFQANKRLASPVIPGTLSVSHIHLLLQPLDSLKVPQIVFELATNCRSQKNDKKLCSFCCFHQPAGTAGAQVVHAQQRAVAATAAPTEVVAIAAGQSVRAVTPVSASAVVSTTLSPVQTQNRPLVPQVAPGTELQIPLSRNFL